MGSVLLGVSSVVCSSRNVVDEEDEKSDEEGGTVVVASNDGNRDKFGDGSTDSSDDGGANGGEDGAATDGVKESPTRTLSVLPCEPFRITFHCRSCNLLLDCWLALCASVRRLSRLALNDRDDLLSGPRPSSSDGTVGCIVVIFENFCFCFARQRVLPCGAGVLPRGSRVSGFENRRSNGAMWPTRDGGKNWNVNFRPRIGATKGANDHLR